MACTATLQRPQEKTNTWSSIFPNEQVTEQQSALFVKKLLAVAISNIAYLRAIFPEHAFGDRCLEGLNLKIMRDDSACPGASQVIKWVKGCFDAVDKKYLRMLIMGIYLDSEDPDTVIESYTFKFSYKNSAEMDVYRNEKKIASTDSVLETKKATIRLLRTMVVLTQTLKSLPDDVMLTMKLLYYDDYTPADYEPPGFKPAQTDTFVFDEEPMNIKVGDVSTQFHTIKMRIKTDSKQFELKDDPAEVGDKENVEGQAQEEDTCMVESEKEEMEQEEQEVQECKSDVYSFINDDVQTEKVPLRGKQSKKCHTPDAVVPTEMPAMPGSTDRAIDTTGSQKSQISVQDEDLGVRCPCGCYEDDGLMILCAICNAWQHGVCFLVQSENDAPTRHICDICGEPGNQEKEPTDPYLNTLSSIGVQATCLWRRALMATSEMNRVIGPNLARRLGVEMAVAQGLMNRLEKEGFIRNAGKGKRLGKIVEKSKILNEGIPRYFKKKTCQHKEQSEKTLTPKEDIPISQLTEMAEGISLSRKKKGKKNKKKTTVAPVEEVRCSPRLSIDMNEEEEFTAPVPTKKGRKRAISKVDGNHEFDVCDSQDVYDEPRTSKRKASIVSREIMV
ncbi:HORMA domain-containing protein 1-like [Mizuhopecten yessoensis]|uniref:HORMA domain-containing protein 1 n=1 Tax=Mizuhopecten yessoensis TaxID=6573 RepID=A0A210QPD8_MIZYE|nr:HORMA domain-containing protein 1-like [Mizuhopecten yessoensis]XP_021353391.1 HORMA domain-containing protein 1-like [Mizuhopecten yessoensis]OWF50585.1 HORMA domain-containing protein 1 [Mizuhopecten yessoensis]